MKTLQRIDETAYLNAENAERYRAIMRIFFRAEESSKFELYTEDVLEELHENYEGFADIDDTKIKSDLAQLVAWKSLIAVQDPKKVYTIAEYKNKKFRYSMSKVALEVERMTIRLENLPLESAGLSNNYFIRIENSLKRFPSEKNAMELKEVNAWWKDLSEDFKRLNQQNQDYIRQFYTGNGEKMMKSIDFVLHKDHFISYLKEYIQQLQSHSNTIAALLKEISFSDEEKFFSDYVESEMQIPRTEKLEDEDLFKEQIEMRVRDTWKNIHQWFIGESGISESMSILDKTNDIIHRIVQNASMIIQMQNLGMNRKNEYQKWIKMFQDCETLEEAHCLSAVVFGVQNTHHFEVNDARETDSIFSASSEEEPFTYILSSHSRTYRPRTEKSSFTADTLEQAHQRELYLLKMDENRREVLKYIHHKQLEIQHIDEVISASLRSALLGWIATANMNESKTGRNEYGWKYQVEKGKDECVLHCADGDLTMPNYIIRFEDIA